MSKIGGHSAFPIYVRGAQNDLHLGMTLRQYYAGIALGAVITNPSYESAKIHIGDAWDIARVAVILADALLAELEKP